MIKVVPDTNLMLAGMMGYKSPERKIANLALSKKIQLVSCSDMLAEFNEKIRIPRMMKYWSKKYFSIDKIIQDYQSLTIVHEPTPQYMNMAIPISDQDDSIFFKLALSSGSKIIVSSDHHLLSLKGYMGIKVATPKEFFDAFEKIKSTS